MKYFLSFLLLAGCGAAQLTSNDRTEVAQYAAELAACDTQASDAGRQDCKDAVTRRWRAHWNAEFDGGF